MLPTQPTLTNEEGVQPQLLESFQVPSQVVDSIVSERVTSGDSASSVILVHDSLHQELRTTGEVNGLIKTCKAAPFRERTPTRLPSTQKYLPSTLTGWMGPAILNSCTVSFMPRLFE